MTATMEKGMIEMKVRDLKLGDIFSFGKNVWDAASVFHGINFYNDKSEKWEKNFSEDCRICFHLSYIHGDGTFKGMFKWSDTNSVEQIVYIPQFPMSAHKKTKDQYCIPRGNHRHIFQFPLNDINKLKTYCPDN